MLSVSAVSFAYPNTKPVLEDITLRAEASEVLAVVGRNGAGKSTLLQLLNGLLTPRSGAISVDGFSTATTPVHLLARHIGTVFQAPEQQIFNPTVRAEIGFGLRQLGLTGRDLIERIDAVLERTYLSEYAASHPLDLDQATLRMLALGSVLAMAPPILLLDEPQRGLDARAIARLASIVREEAGRGACIVLVCHDMEFVAAMADRVIALAQGRLVADRSTIDFFGSPETLRASGVEAPDSLLLAGELNLEPALSPAALAGAWLRTHAHQACATQPAKLT
jgi:energy-coupling factor transport system ATP-binding protein